MPQQAQFDLDAARKSGATDDQILSYLSQRSPNFDVQGALKQSSKGDVISYLAAHAVPPTAGTQSQQPQQPSFGDKLTAGYNPGATEFGEKHPVLGPAARFFDAAGGAVLGLPSNIYHAFADPATEEEKRKFGSDEDANAHWYVPNANNIGPTGRAIVRMVGEPIENAAQQYANPETRPTFGDAMSVLPEALGQGAGGYAGSELLGKGVSAATKPLSTSLKNSATKQYQKALSPTKAENKFLAQKITPQLLDRGVSGSLEGINEQAQAAMEDVGPQISAAVKKVPQAKQLAIQPVLQALEDYKDTFKVNGAEMRPDAVARATELQDTIKQLGPDVSYASLNRARQIFDEVVAQGKGYYGKTLAEGGTLDVQREAANAIRQELAKDRPDIAKLNKEYSFWANVEKVTGDTLQRRSGQEGALLPKLGAIGGAATGHLPSGGALYLLGRVLQSPRWRTFSAVKKTQIANAIAAGDAATLTKLIGLGASAYGAQQQ
jgi:hypothetical protein